MWFMRLMFGNISNAMFASTAFFCLYLLSLWVYRLWFHPLRKFPGPSTAAISSLPAAFELVRGTSIFWIVDLHARYDSEVIRVSPNELSFCSANAYREIYAHKKADMPVLLKDPVFYRSPLNEIEIVNATEPEDHVRMRKVFSSAFSDRALTLQEPIFKIYVDKLVQKIRQGLEVDAKTKFDVVELYNYTTLDVMADLTFGEPLNLHDCEDYRPWVAAIFAGFKYTIFLHAIRYFPWLEWFLITYCIPQSIMDSVKLHRAFSQQRVDRRLERQLDRPDIWGLAVSKEGEESGLTREEMYANSDVFMVAGTETTGTLISGLTYHLLANRDKLNKLTSELRNAIPSENEITIKNLLKLKYLNACIDEGLRLYPPAVHGFPRITPQGRMTVIDGREVPPGTKVFVASLAAGLNPRNWHEPSTFLPERFLSDDPEGESTLDLSFFINDKRRGHLPFSSGPRVCLGKNMAWQEIRLIIAKVFYNFDLSLAPESENWIKNQKVWLTWDKPPLYCNITPCR